MGLWVNKEILMKPIMILGIVLIVVGVIALSYHGITYKTHEKVLKIGPIEATKETEKTIPLPPVLGGVLLTAGIVIMLWSQKVGWEV
jgi:hypothetical protein